MKYTVLWLESAEAKLADIWLGATDRSAITRAARQIDVLLQNRPQTRGESRPGDRRILLLAPLGVTFEVKDADAIVNVLSVWRFRSH